MIKCLAYFFRNTGLWALSNYAPAKAWFDPIPAHTVILISTIIVFVINERARSQRIQRLDASQDTGKLSSDECVYKQHDNTIRTVLYFKVKNSWQNMSTEKQLATRQLLTKKVLQMSQLDENHPDATPVANKWDETLDDLYDDPDFEEVYRSASILGSIANLE